MAEIENQYYDPKPEAQYVRFEDLPQDIQDFITDNQLEKQFSVGFFGTFIGAEELIARTLDASTPAGKDLKAFIQNFAVSGGGTLRDLPDPTDPETHFVAPEYEDQENQLSFTPDRYLVSWKPLAQGGFGEIFFGIDMIHKKPIIVKTQRSDRSEHSKSLYKEALTLAFCGDAHMMRVENVFLRDEKIYCIYEFLDPKDFPTLDKVDFDSMQQSERWETGLTMLTQMAGTLDHLFSQYGFLHRDFKPANIFWNKGENLVKIGDVGISSWVTHETIPDGTILASMDWHSPESVTANHTEDEKDFLDESWCFANVAWYIFHSQSFYESLRNWPNGAVGTERRNAHQPTRNIENATNAMPQNPLSMEQLIGQDVFNFYHLNEGFFQFLSGSQNTSQSFPLPAEAYKVFAKALSADRTQRYSSLTEFVSDLQQALS